MNNISTFWAYLYCAGYEFQHPDYSQQKEPNFHTQKSLMIPKRKLEAINHRMSNNAMAKREGTKRQTLQWPREKGQKDKQWYTNQYIENEIKIRRCHECCFTYWMITQRNGEQFL